MGQDGHCEGATTTPDISPRHHERFSLFIKFKVQNAGPHRLVSSQCTLSIILVAKRHDYGHHHAKIYFDLSCKHVK